MAADHDALRSGAIFRVQREQYSALRSPVPRLVPNGASLAHPTPVYANTFDPVAVALSPTSRSFRTEDESGASMKSFQAEESSSTALSVSEDVRYGFRELCCSSPLARVYLPRSVSNSAAGTSVSATSLLGPSASPDAYLRPCGYSSCEGSATNFVSYTTDVRQLGAAPTQGGVEDTQSLILRYSEVCDCVSVDNNLHQAIGMLAEEGNKLIAGKLDQTKSYPTRSSSTHMAPTEGEAVNDSTTSRPCRHQTQSRAPQHTLVPDRENAKFVSHQNATCTPTTGAISTGVEERKAPYLRLSDRATVSRVPTSRKRTRTAMTLDTGHEDEDGDIASARGKLKVVPAGVVHVKTTRSGRSSVPVLDWWRSQRLSRTPDGKIVVSLGSSQDQLSPVKSMAQSCTVHVPHNSGAHPLSPNVKANRDHIEKPQGDAAVWTQAQLRGLHTAQMGTAPSAKDFWDVVASKVGGKDPQECQQKWFEHFAAPKLRRRRAGSRCSSAKKGDEPVATDSPVLLQVIHDTRTGDANFPAHQPAAGAVADDLFQATPMRSRARQNSGTCSGPTTPETPAGPGAPADEVPSTGTPHGESGPAGYTRGVSTKYVQAMSKRMRKTSRASRKRGARQDGPEKSGCTASYVSARRIQATTRSRGRSIKASVATSGAVSITSSGGGDSSDIGLSDCVDSSDTDT